MAILEQLEMLLPLTTAVNFQQQIEIMIIMQVETVPNDTVEPGGITPVKNQT